MRDYSNNYGKTKCTHHNGSGTRLYRIYNNMLTRCFTQKSKDYRLYGGKGIKVCAEWLGDNGFVNFRNWSLQNGYDDTLTIDRINSNGNYEPQNCRWTTNKVQMNNTCRNRYIEFQGERHTVTEWSEITGLSLETILSRLRYKWTIKDTLTKPIKIHKRHDKARRNIYEDKFGFALVIKNKYIGRYKTLEEAIAKRDSILGVVQ